MIPKDTKGRFIKTNSKTFYDIFGGRKTPSLVNSEHRYSGNNPHRGKAQEIVEEELRSLDRGIEEQEVQPLGETKLTHIESPVTKFLFLQPIKTSIPNISSLKDRVKNFGIIENNSHPYKFPIHLNFLQIPSRFYLFKKKQY